MRRKADSKRVLEITAEMQGTLEFKDPVDLKINGAFNGTLDTKGSLEIGENAQVEATIRGEDVVISGHVRGQVTATNSLKLTATCVLQGDISAKALEIDFGAFFEGQASMNVPKASRNANHMSLEEISDYLNINVDKIAKWVKRDKIPVDQTESGELCFDKEKIDQWVLDNRLVLK